MAKPGKSAKPGPLVKHTLQSESNANRQRGAAIHLQGAIYCPPPSLRVRAPLYRTHLALAPASPPQALTHQNLCPQPSTSPHHFAAHPVLELRRTEPGFFRPPREAGGLRKPGAGRGVQGKACHRRGVASAALHRSPWRPRNLFPSEKIFYLRALLPHATVCQAHPLLLDANICDANIVSGNG